MILPTKFTNIKSSYLGLGALVLNNLHSPQAVSDLWIKLKINPEIATYQRFIKTLFILYSLGAIDLKNGLIYRSMS